MLGKKKQFRLEHSFRAPIETVWQAWTDAEMLRNWWGPEGTTVDDCEIDLVVGGRLLIVTVAGESMGKYAGTRWPMSGTITRLDHGRTLAYDARSWTDGKEAASMIEHTNLVTFESAGANTIVRLEVDITAVGPKAKLASAGMKMGYKSHLKRLGGLLTAEG